MSITQIEVVSLAGAGTLSLGPPPPRATDRRRRVLQQDLRPRVINHSASQTYRGPLAQVVREQAQPLVRVDRDDYSIDPRFIGRRIEVGSRRPRSRRSCWTPANLRPDTAARSLAGSRSPTPLSGATRSTRRIDA